MSARAPLDKGFRFRSELPQAGAQRITGDRQAGIIYLVAVKGPQLNAIGGRLKNALPVAIKESEGFAFCGGIPVVMKVLAIKQDGQ